MAASRLVRQRLILKLQEQLRFIQRSCNAFDQGAEDEALRLATSLRVVFHNSTQSVSLMSHLGLGNQSILSSSRGHGNWQDYLGHYINLSSPNPIRMVPLLGNQFRVISITDWWQNEPVFVHDAKSYSRRVIILSAANKDGGAHVDESLEKYYEILCTGEFALGITGDLKYQGAPPFPQGVTIYAKNAHLALIRQFAHETLTSAARLNWLKDE